MASPVTVQQIVDTARSRHWTFNDVLMPDGAIVQHLNEKQRILLLTVIDEVEALIGETQDVEVDGTGTLIALDDDGAPYFTTTRQTAYAIRMSGGVPYIDLTDPFVVDPFGEDGDVPGIPLSEDLLRLVSVQALLDDDRMLPVKILDMTTAVSSPSRGLVAFINANRLVPHRVTGSGGITDSWTHVVALRIAQVRCPSIAAMADTMTMPIALVSALTASVAEFLSTAAREISEADKRRFERQRAEAEAALIANADEVLSKVMTNSVITKGR